MRKKIVQPGNEELAGGARWLDLERLARVELTSEDPASPLEAALSPGEGGWRAAQPGDQVIRFFFEQPQRLGRIRLRFLEQTQARTQELALRWSADGGQTYREIVRQQYTFSPPGTILEDEVYEVSLEGVTAVELQLRPDIGQGGAYASLQLVQLA